MQTTMLRLATQALWPMLVVVVAGVRLSERAGAATFTDTGTFAISQWSEVILGAGDVVDTRDSTGGNPGAHLRVETIPNGGSIVYGVYLNDAATWEPSIQGEISTVDMGIDVILFEGIGDPRFTDGQAYGIGLQQGAQIFRSVLPIIGDPQATWDERTIPSVDQSSFFLVNPDGSTDNSVHPDFSASGSRITFGFLGANSGGSPISGTVAGYDNWNLTVNLVPEPTALIPLGVSLAALLACRRRRTTADR